MLDDDTKAKILDHYQKGQGSIQDIARVYRVSVDEVLLIIGESDLSTVAITGDLIDQTEAGPNTALSHGGTVKVPFDVS